MVRWWRFPVWALPWLLLFLALVGLGALALLWAVGAFRLLLGGLAALGRRLVRPRRRWRRLPALRD